MLPQTRDDGSTNNECIYLVRHAEAKWGEVENRPLSKTGLQAAVQVADILVAYPIDLIYSSPYLRAIIPP